MIYYFFYFFLFFLDFNGNEATNRTHREIQCLPYAGFLLKQPSSAGRLSIHVRPPECKDFLINVVSSLSSKDTFLPNKCSVGP